MKRASLVIVVLIMIAGCPMGAPTLELSAGAVTIGSESRVTASAVNADGTPGSGTVTFASSLGALSAASAALTDGAASVKLSCPRTVSGCVAGASIEITARWTSPKGELVKTVVARVNEPGQPGDAGQPNDGGTDAGTDGGALDGGDSDAGFDAGLILDGTPLGGIDGLVLGRLGSPRTLGFSPLDSNTDVRLGFDRQPTMALIFGDRLIYVRDGTARLWTVDEIDAGDPDAGDADAGEADAGDVDAGSRDAGVRDGGLDAGPGTGPFPLYAPEANDPILETCHGAFGAPDGGTVRALLVTPTGNLWIGCSDLPTDTDVIYRLGSTLLFPTVTGRAVAALDDTLFLAHPDGGRFLATSARADQLVLAPKRWAEKAVRAVPGGFEMLAYDPLLTLCVLVTVDARTATPRDVLLDGFQLGDQRCLEGQFYGGRDLLLVPHTDGGPTDGIEAFPFSRRIPPRDAGTTDGGARDGGAQDAGVDAGPEPYLGFFPGPPSNFLAQPPELSIDFSSPVQVITRP